jgi:hypothetical protein
MYIPRPAKSSSPSMTAGIYFSKNLAITSAPGPASALSACSSAAPPAWASAVTAVRLRTAPTPAFSARAVSQRPSAPAASNPPSSGCHSRAISCQIAIGSISPSLYPICCGCFLTTTGPCSTPFFVQQPGGCSDGPAGRAWRSVSSAPYTPTAVIRLLRHSDDLINHDSLPRLRHIREKKQWQRYLQAQYERHWKVHFAKKTRGAWRCVKYLGRYLKRPPVSAAKLRHNGGCAVVYHYYDHQTQQYRRQALSKEKIIAWFIIPSSNKRSELPSLYSHEYLLFIMKK